MYSIKQKYYGDNVLSVRQAYQTINTKINKYPDSIEVIRYADNLVVRRKGIEMDIAPRQRLFTVNDKGNYIAKSCNATLSRLLDNFRRSKSRSMDMVYNYILSNQWRYFCTFTFAPDKVEDRFSMCCIKKCWRVFRDRLRHFFPSAYVCAIPEPHPTSNAIHLHALIGGADLSLWMKDSGHKSSFGDTIYNFILYDFGFSTVVDLGTDPCKLRLANYCAKYISKDMYCEYNKRRYFASKGLKHRDSIVYNLEEEDFAAFLKYNTHTPIGENFSIFDFNPIEVERVKSLDKMDIYRVYLSSS